MTATRPSAALPSLGSVEHIPATDLPRLLQRAVDEAVRLMEADGGIVDLLDPVTQTMKWGFDAGIDPAIKARWAPLVELPVGVGIYGLAVRERRVQVSNEYLDDERFPHANAPDGLAMEIGIRSSIAAPLIGSGGPLGVLGVFAKRPNAFGEREVALIRALADHAAVALENARLIDELTGSQVELARRAEAERTLREIAARITAIRDPGELLQRAVEEAVRLLHAHGAIIYLLDPGTGNLYWAHDAGISTDEDRAWFRSVELSVGRGMFGSSVADSCVRITGDYANDTSFEHAESPDRVVREVDIRSMVVAPLVGPDGPLGAIGAYSTRNDAFGDSDGALLHALADHAAIAIVNARLIEQLGRSQVELERRAEEERALREIAARITALRDPGEVLQRVVDDARRLMSADGAHMTLLDETGRVLVPDVIAGNTDEEMRAWLHGLRFPLDGGMNGLAATLGRPVRTVDYLIDPRIPHEEGDQDTALRLGLRGMAVAPLRASAGAIIGTLAISYQQPREVNDAEIALLQSLADQAAIAVTNARLYDELSRSEARYRFLLQQSPDIAWSVDAEGHFTFLSDSVERVTGWQPEQMLGRHFAEIVHPNSQRVTFGTWEQMRSDPANEKRMRFDLLHRDGRPIAGELVGIAILADGEFAGAHGSVRDMTERDRLERDLLRQAGELAASQERAHLARELHDSVTQALFSMTLTTRSVELLMERDPDAAVRKLGELHELERDALAEMRALIFELRPGSLEQDGLVQALRTHAAAVQGRTGLPVLVEADPLDRLPIELEDALFRIAQEALHNAVKHSSASRVHVRLERSRDGVCLSVEDDGVGFDQTAVPSGHLGVAGMRTRAEQLGARLEVQSRKGQGTRIAVEASAPPPPAE